MTLPILLTGASGFIGSTLATRILADGEHLLRVAVREGCRYPHPLTDVFEYRGLEFPTNWAPALAGIHTVIHCAALAHAPAPHQGEALDTFKRIHVHGSYDLARQAARAGVRRFIYLSSIKVNGEQTAPGSPYRADSPPAPVDPYGQAKLAAEEALRELAHRSGLEVVVIRPPLVYGPGVGANFLRLMQWVHSGVPLPFASIDNRRSLIAADNLCDLILHCIDHPAAPAQTWLASDGEDLSTPGLIACLAKALGRPCRLLPLPPALLDCLARLCGQGAALSRLTQSLQIDISATREHLQWEPPHTFADALSRTVTHYLADATQRR